MGKLFDSLSWWIYSIQRAILFLLLKIKYGKSILENSWAIYHLKHMLIIGPSNSTTMYLVNKVAIIIPIL